MTVNTSNVRPRRPWCKNKSPKVPKSKVRRKPVKKMSLSGGGEKQTKCIPEKIATLPYNK